MAMMRARCSGTAAVVLLGLLSGAACTGAVEPNPRAQPAGPGAHAGASGAIGAGASGFAGTGVSGDEGNAAGTTGGTGEPFAATLPAATLRRLTPVQYQNSVRDLLGVAPDVTSLSAIPPLNGLQAIGASTVSLAEVDLEIFERLADDVAARVFGDAAARERVVGCDAAQAACSAGFVEGFGKRAFRRPLSSDERVRYSGLRDRAESMTGDAWLALRVVTSAFLQSPSFLYREELGSPALLADAPRRLDAFELASRVAFFLTDTLPDVALLEAAERGELDSAESLRAQAERLMSSSGASAASEQLFTDYLRLDALDDLVKLSDVYPTATDSLAEAMKQETLASLRDLLFARPLVRLEELRVAPRPEVVVRVALGDCGGRPGYGAGLARSAAGIAFGSRRLIALIGASAHGDDPVGGFPSAESPAAGAR
jgi:hypothetical protein